MDEATTIELNKILARRREEQRAREREEHQKQQREARENARKRVKAVEDFLEEYVGERLWEPPKQRADGYLAKCWDGDLIVKLKKKFRYCDMALLHVDKTNKNKITGITLCCLFDSKYENAAMLKEENAMLKELDGRFGVRGGGLWYHKRKVEGIYSYWINSGIDSRILGLSYQGEPKKGLAVEFEREGNPPRDDVKKELPPL